MSNYLILGPNFKGRIRTNPVYRGLDRVDVPDVPKDLSKAKLINDAIEKYMESRDLTIENGEYLNDYGLASEIAAIFTKNNENGEKYEVVQVVDRDDGDEPQQVKFIGYDVISTNEHGSLIVTIFNGKSSKLSGEFEMYKSQLNENFLFEDKKVAQEFSAAISKRLGSTFSVKIVGLYASN